MSYLSIDMPRGRGRKQWKRKPYRFRKRKAAKRTVNVNRALQPIPQRYIAKMKFAADVVTGATGIITFNLNSIYDPLGSGAPSPDQPYGRDQLALLYNRYRVISCGWRITAPNTGGIIQVGALPSNQSITPGSFSDIRENPRAKYFMQHPTGTPLLLKGKTYIPSLVGRTKSQYMADDRYQSLMTTNPSELALLNVAVATSSGVLLTAGQVLNVLMEFTVEFFDVHVVPPS